MKEMPTRRDERHRYYDFSHLDDLERHLPLVRRTMSGNLWYFGMVDQVTLHDFKAIPGKKEYLSVTIKDGWGKQMSAILSLRRNEIAKIFDESSLRQYLIDFEIPRQGPPRILAVRKDVDKEGPDNSGDDGDDEGIPPRRPMPSRLEPMGVR
jgi:hypothetical protein